MKPTSYYTALAIVSPNDSKFSDRVHEIPCCLKNCLVRNIIAFVSRLFFGIGYCIAKSHLQTFQLESYSASSALPAAPNASSTPQQIARPTPRPRQVSSAPIRVAEPTRPASHTLLNTVKKYQHGTRSYPATLETANQEIESGKKTSHWIWYVFPGHHGISAKIGIPSSHMNDECCMRSSKDVVNFLKDNELREAYKSSLRSIIKAFREGHTLKDIFGLDRLKVISSLTLFHHIDSAQGGDHAISHMIEIIWRASNFFDWCLHTQELLQEEANREWASQRG